MASAVCPNPSCGSTEIRRILCTGYVDPRFPSLAMLLVSPLFRLGAAGLFLAGAAFVGLLLVVGRASSAQSTTAVSLLIVGAILSGFYLFYLSSLESYRVYQFCCRRCGYQWVEGRITYRQAALESQNPPARYRQPKRHAAYARVLLGSGALGLYDDTLAEARAASEEALTLFDELGDDAGVASAKNLAGLAALFQGDYERAESLIQASLDAYRRMSDWYGISAALDSLGQTALFRGDYDRAVPLLEESLALKQKLRYAVGTGWSLLALAEVAGARGQHDRAVRLASAGAALFEDHEWPIPPALQARQERVLASARQAVGGEVFATAWEEGEALEMDQAIDYALSANVHSGE